MPLYLRKNETLGNLSGKIGDDEIYRREYWENFSMKNKSKYLIKIQFDVKVMK
jgi:hypothetical protein